MPCPSVQNFNRIIDSHRARGEDRSVHPSASLVTAIQKLHDREQRRRAVSASFGIIG